MNDITSIFFFTKVIHHRIPIFSMDKKYPLIVIENLNFYRKKFGFALYGYVIMPEHYHLVIDTKGQTSITKIKEDMNKYIAQEILNEMKNNHDELLQRFKIEPRIRRGHVTQAYGMFQKGGVDFEILRDEKLLEKIEYIHRNPVRKGIVSQMESYSFSSARNYIAGDHSLIVLDPLPM